MDIKMFDKEYFNRRSKQCEDAIAYGDYCERKARFYKRLYELTGMKWAEKRNRYWVEKGMMHLIANMAVMVSIDIPVLEKLSKGE